MKRYCSQKIQKSISEPQESRKEWLIWMMERAALKVSKVNKRMLWQHHNKPIEIVESRSNHAEIKLYSSKACERRVHNHCRALEIE